MSSRRGFLAGMLAAAIAPRPTWADVGNPHYLAAARMTDSSYRLFGLGEDGHVIFNLPLPGRGHAAAAHPTRPEAVAFARRPGTFAIVIDCLTQKITTELKTPPGRHFYGHGAFSTDGLLLFTTENDYEAGQGRIGVWDAKNGFRRIGEFASGGIGPHEVLLLPNREILVVANGGIDTHPQTGRTKLNIPEMSPRLTYLDYSGNLVEQVSLDAGLHLNSIRHLSAREDGLISFAMQWQGEMNNDTPLLGLHQLGKEPLLLQSPERQHARMRGYGASVAFSGEGQSVAISSSRGGQVQIFDVAQGAYLSSYFAPDVSGLSKSSNGFAVTSGNGEIVSLKGNKTVWRTRHPQNWDNHLVSISQSLN